MSASPGPPFPYIQLERTFGGDIYAQSPIVFDHILLSNGSIDCNTIKGDISINIRGVYFIKWFVVPQEGLSTDGGDFSIAGDNSKDRQGSSHMKNASVPGLAMAVVPGLSALSQEKEMEYGVISAAGTNN